MAYKQARKDHEYLWDTYGPAYDMTGAYVDSDDLKKLLESPTKATAAECYENQIIYWLQTGPEAEFGPPPKDFRKDRRVQSIAKRYYVDLERWHGDHTTEPLRVRRP